MKIFTTVISGVGHNIARGDGQVIGNMQNMLYRQRRLYPVHHSLVVLYLFTQKGFCAKLERSGLVG